MLETPVAAFAAWWLMEPSAELTSIPWLLLITVGVTVVVTSGDGEKTAPRQDKHRKGTRPYPDRVPYTPQIPSATGEFATGEREPITPQRAFLAVWPTSPEPQPSISYSRRALRCTRDGRGALGAVKRLGSARRERRWSGPLGVVRLGHAEEFGELARRIEGDDCPWQMWPGGRPRCGRA